MSDYSPTIVLDQPVILGASTGTPEVQKVDFSVQEAAKTSNLEIDGAKSASIKQKSEVTAAEVKTILEGLPNVGPVGSGQTYEIASVTGTGGVLTITFGKGGNVPTIVATSTGTPAPTVTTVTQGVSPAEAVIRGLPPQADATARVQPRLNGVSPKSDRAAHASTYGD